MVYQVLEEDRQPLDAHLDLDSWGINLHSRGGSKGQASARNLDYGPALRILLQRISDAGLPIAGAWVDSSRVQHLEIGARSILASDELKSGLLEAFRLMSTRMANIGQSEQGGNPTKRIRIQFSREGQIPYLMEVLKVQRVQRDLRSLDRLPANDLRKVSALHIWKAVQRLLQDPADHDFGPSTDFDLLNDAGDRLPPKAVFGLAASEALGFPVLPRHFTGGRGTPCFIALEKAGYEIVQKGAASAARDLPCNPHDREWAEGRAMLISHLKRERASGLANAKKAEFVRQHGRLFCERCSMDPHQVFGGAHGLACIEVHHHVVHVADMSDAHITRLKDLQCLTALCTTF